MIVVISFKSMKFGFNSNDTNESDFITLYDDV